MDIKDIKYIEKANRKAHSDTLKLGIILMFAIFIATLAVIYGPLKPSIILILASIIGGYMALSIGANDVANNLGPTVGSKAISLFGAIVIAAIFEASGSIIAGGSVVKTIKSGIIDPKVLSSNIAVLNIMLSALLAGAIWLHLATILRAPVSTTHSIVGGIMGAGIAYGGLSAVNVVPLVKIVSSWVISPVLGGVIAAGFLIFIKYQITYKKDKLSASAKILPILIFIMTWVFGAYIIIKGLKQVIKMPTYAAFSLALALACVVLIIVKPLIKKKIKTLNNTKEDVNSLFTIPLIFAAAILSFAHGANDVANAIGPLAAINQALGENVGSFAKANIPIWIMVIGGFGISLGLMLYGPRLIKTVGGEITELDKMRAFCIAISSGLTVLLASQLGLPVSSTHIAIGAILGVGFLREYIKRRYVGMQNVIIEKHEGKDEEAINNFLNRFNNSSISKKAKILEALKRREVEFTDGVVLDKEERKSLKKVYKEELVKRSTIGKIIASWIITVPFSALLAAGILFLMEYFDVVNLLM